MKDVFGRILSVGDSVVYMYGSATSLYGGVITRFTPKRIVVRERTPTGSLCKWDTFRAPDQVCWRAGREAQPTDDYWGEYVQFPSKEWIYETSNRITRRGYWAWVDAKKEEFNWDSQPCI